MKLEAAAAVLGVAVDADPETLKAAYRRLALRWHPDKCKDADAKEKFQEVSVAYRRLVCGESGRDQDSDGCDRFYDDVDEMQAFRSMFMELVDMLGSDMPPMSNGCVPGCQGGHSHISPGLPPDMANMPNATSVALNMMFGERPQDETWSSEDEEEEEEEEEDEEGEGVEDEDDEEEDDEEEEEEDYDHDEEEFDLDGDGEPDVNDQDADSKGDVTPGCSAGTVTAETCKSEPGSAMRTSGVGVGGGEGLWEPMVRHYFHMNLKEEAEQLRAARGDGVEIDVGVGEAVDLEDEEVLRQSRAIRKRQEKKRRQKEKKALLKNPTARLELVQREIAGQREAATSISSATAGASGSQNTGGKTREAMLAAKRREEARLKKKEEEDRRLELFAACRGGDVEEVRLLLGTGIVRCTERERENGQSGASLLHACVTKFTGEIEDEAYLKTLAADRLSIAAMVLECVDPAVDAGAVDHSGLTVLHRVAQGLDLAYLSLLLEERQKSQERRHQILLNERCLEKGWTPLHYAAAEGSPSGVATLLSAGSSVNMQGAVITDIASNGGSGLAGTGGGNDEAESGTALQLTRALLSKEAAGPRKKGLQEVARQLSAAMAALERAKEQRERKEREAKLAKKRSEAQKEKKKEAKERELLSRKQRQLKDKQERQEREERQEEERRGRKEEGKDETKTKKAKKAKRKKNKSVGCDDDDAGGGANRNWASTDGDAGGGISGVASRSSSSGAPTAALGAPVKASNVNTNAVTSTVDITSAVTLHETAMSRDDLLAQLITMGFKEEHVHRGTACVGFDLDGLLSWLCEHPDGGGTTPAEQANSNASKATMSARRGRSRSDSKSNVKVDAGKGNSGTIVSTALRNHGSLGGSGPVVWGGIGTGAGGGSGVGGGKDGATAGGVGAGSGFTTMAAAAAAKAEEKRKHNLELRRINRAWNASLPLRRMEEEKAAESAREKELEEARDEMRRQLEANRSVSAPRQVSSLRVSTVTKPMQISHNLFPVLGSTTGGGGGGGSMSASSSVSNKTSVRAAASLPTSKILSQGIPIGSTGLSLNGSQVRGGINGSASNSGSGHSSVIGTGEGIRGGVGDGIVGKISGSGHGSSSSNGNASSNAGNSGSEVSNHKSHGRVAGSGAIGSSSGGAGGSAVTTTGESGGTTPSKAAHSVLHLARSPSPSSHAASRRGSNGGSGGTGGGGVGETTPGGRTGSGNGNGGSQQQQQQQQQQQPQQQPYQQLQQIHSAVSGPVPFGGGAGAGVSNGTGGGSGSGPGAHVPGGAAPPSGNGTGSGNGVGLAGGGAGAGAGTRPSPFPPGVGRGHMAPIPAFAPHGPHPAPPPGTPIGLPMGVPPHLAHMSLPGQPVPFPGFRHTQAGPPGAHGPLPPRPRNGPPHGYGAGIPVQQPQGPHAEWMARQRAAAAGWGNSPAGVPVQGAAPGLHPHALQHPPRHGGPPAGLPGPPMPHPWGEGWGVGPPPSPAAAAAAAAAAAVVALGGPPDADGSPAMSPAVVLQHHQQQHHHHHHHSQQRRRQHQHQPHDQHLHGQRQRPEAAGVVASGPTVSSLSGVSSSESATSTSAPPAPASATASATPLKAPSASSLTDSPVSATEITSAVANGELSASARVFVPTRMSPAKPANSVSGGTPGSGGGEQRRPGAGGGTAMSAMAAAAVATPPRPPVSASLRTPPAKVGTPLALSLGDSVFSSSWSSMGTSASGVGKAGATSATDAVTGLTGDEDSGSGSLWGGVGLGVGRGSRTGTVPPSGQAIWGSSSLLDSALSGGTGAGTGGSDGALSSLLLPPASSTAAVDSSTLPFPSALDLSWDVSDALPRESSGNGAGASVELGGDDFAGSLGASLRGLQLDEPDLMPLGSKAGQQDLQPEPRDLFGATSTDTGAGLSWG